MLQLKPTSPAVKAQACYDQSKAITALVEEVLKDILAADPTLLDRALIGVVDGSPAAAGHVGELWTGTTTGTWTGGGSNTVVPQPNLVVPQPALPAGDWDVQWHITLPSVGTAGVGAALCRLPPPLPAGCLNNMAGYAVNIPTNMAPAADGGLQPLVINGPSAPISTRFTQGLVFNLFIWPSGLATTGPFTFNAWARRRR